VKVLFIRGSYGCSAREMRLRFVIDECPQRANIPFRRSVNRIKNSRYRERVAKAKARERRRRSMGHNLAPSHPACNATWIDALTGRNTSSIPSIKSKPPVGSD
jgi:hypothetical protein